MAILVETSPCPSRASPADAEGSYVQVTPGQWAELLDSQHDQRPARLRGAYVALLAVTEQLERGLKTSAKGKCNLGSSSMVKQNKRRSRKLSPALARTTDTKRREEAQVWDLFPTSALHPPVRTCQLFPEYLLRRNRQDTVPESARRGRLLHKNKW